MSVPLQEDRFALRNPLLRQAPKRYQILLFACGRHVNSETDMLKSDEHAGVSKDLKNQPDSLSLVQTNQGNKGDNISIWRYDYMADTIIQLRKIKIDTLT
ncbi:MAG TPA: hypothetical protein PLL28_12540 [Chitinophagales bacterium]|nr:hypothetical protein [Chitinophagales bacterium]HMZ88472.1 hypothetical protein [Chitinophagales bacterium]HNF70198.1 hypothetical protein [Chitinophagales bacterium]HNK98887.1 hypothetical protein [Chitinophagales bacterium]HNO29887.1 hypothetical protein [Chitinophagales bacterium]